MARWVRYARERFPLLSYGALSAGISLSGIYLKTSFQLIPFLFSFAGILFALGVLRIFEDYRNLDKDRIAHKEYPFARGLMKPHEVRQALSVLQVVFFAYSLAVWVFANAEAGLMYALAALCFWGLQKGGSRNKQPLVEGIAGQIILFPLSFFTIAAAHPKGFLDGASWSFAIMLFGAFFCYDVCRKLNSRAHPVLMYYVHFYGFRRSFEFAAFALAMSAMGASMLHLTALLLPFELFVLGALGLLFFQASLYKVPEVAASISLMVHAWAVAINQL